MKIQKNDISKEIKITMIEVKNTSTINPKILVIGIGGGGNNAVNRMVNSNTCSDSLEYVAINTDQMVLGSTNSDNWSKAYRRLRCRRQSGDRLCFR